VTLRIGPAGFEIAFKWSDFNSPFSNRLATGLPGKFGPENIEGSTLMGPSKHPAKTAAKRRDASAQRSARGSLAALFWLGLTVAATAQGAVRSVHGDWQIRCDTPPGAQGEQCALIQSVVAEDRSNAGLTVIVLKTADQKSKLMRVVAPLGVLLPSGLGLKLDNVDVGRAGFVRCLPNGCVAEVVMDDKLLGQLRTAKTATFIIFETPEEGIGFPLSLNGLGEGFDKLP
jgi:invasion protein IalB